MLNKICDEYKKLKGIVKTDTFCLIDVKDLITLVVRDEYNNYLRYYHVDHIEFDYKDNTLIIHDIKNGYSSPIQNKIIKKITIL